MDLLSIIKECRTLISLGELDKALSLLVNFKDLFDNDIIDEIILISSQFEEHKKNKRLGLINLEDEYRVSTKITFSILQTFNYLLKRIENVNLSPSRHLTPKSIGIEIVQNKILWSFREIPRKIPNHIDLTTNRISPAFIDHEYIVNRKQIQDKVFLHTFSSTVPLVDAVCLNLPFQIESIKKMDINDYYQWQMKIDITHTPIETNFVILVRMIFWNIYRPDNLTAWFCHKVANYRELSFIIDVILPEWKPFLSVKRIIRESTNINEEIELRDNINFNSNFEKTFISWKNDNIKLGYEYYLKWEW